MTSPTMENDTYLKFSVLSVFGIVIVFGYVLHSLWIYWRRPYSYLTRLRGPPMKHWFFGFLTPSEANNFQMSPKLTELCDEFDGVWYASFTNRRPTLVIGDPEAVSYVLNNAQTYVRAEAQMRVTRLLFGDGLVAVDGKQHRKQRKVIGPAFTALAVEKMAPVFYEKARILADAWMQKLGIAVSREGRKMEINAYHDFEALSLDIIGTVGFQYDFHSLTGQRSELEDAFVNVTKSAATGSVYSFLRSHFPLVGILGSLFIQEQQTLDKHRQHICQISRSLIENAKRKRLSQTSKGTVDRSYKDIISLLIESNHRATTKDRLNDDEITFMVPTFLSGGYDNNASELSYALFALTNFPETQRRLRQELLNPPPDCQNWREDVKSLEPLPYLDAVAKETFRLYSSAHSLPRTVSKNDVIPLSKDIQLRDGTWVKEIPVSCGDDVVIAQKWMNVGSRMWGPTAHIFKPERWIEEDGHEYYEGGLPSAVKGDRKSGRKELPGWSHLMTFSIGPRSCPGYRMAVMEFKVCLAVLVSRFDFIKHRDMNEVYGEVQIVDRPRVKGREGYCMPCWIKALE